MRINVLNCIMRFGNNQINCDKDQKKNHLNFVILFFCNDKSKLYNQLQIFSHSIFRKKEHADF